MISETLFGTSYTLTLTDILGFVLKRHFLKRYQVKEMLSSLAPFFHGHTVSVASREVSAADCAVA